MEELTTIVKWFETPRMRWRAVGVMTYVQRLTVSIFTFAMVGALVPLLLALHGGARWLSTHSMWDVLSVPTICVILRLAMECVPGVVSIGNGKLSLKRPLEQGTWLLR